MAKNNWFSPIQDIREAEKTLKESAWSLVGLGFLHILLGYFFIPAVIPDGFIWIILGALLFKFKNRILAVIIGLFSLVTLVVTFLAKAGVTEGGQNIFLAAILVWVSYRIWLSISLLKKSKSSLNEASTI